MRRKGYIIFLMKYDENLNDQTAGAVQGLYYTPHEA